MANQRKTSGNNPKNIIPYGRQYLSWKDIFSVIKTLRSDWLTQGPIGPAFEKALAKIVGSRYAVAVSSGTAALHLAYLASGLKEGDEVITTPNTFAATANMLLVLSAKPVFCDIREDTSNIDESKIESLITEKTKAIVPVHFAGHPCAMEKIWDIASRHNLAVIEDAAHALGAFYKNQPIGSGKSSMTIFSFHPVKSITTGEGGAIATDNQELYEKLKLLRSHGIRKNEQGFNVMTNLGFNYRLSDINSALGLSQLKKLENFIKKRQELADFYFKELENFPEIILPAKDQSIRSSWHLFVIRTKNPEDRLPLYEYLKQSGIGINFHYPPVYSHPYYQENGFKNINLPIADLYAKTAITIPLYPGLTSKQIKKTISSIKNFFSK
ncbi:MAG: UDP-4-amino-4,6-dideoxy-N-acetyl-beta-L-altrosamine transaminase [Candidatus Paceibacterota bacterium]